MNNIKPALVLAVITTFISALLIVAHNLTYVDTSGIITEALEKKCTELMGAGNFSVVTDWKAEGYNIDKPEKVAKLIKKDDGTTAFEIVANGYNKGGLDLLIAMNSDGSINGVKVVSITETPGLGTKVNDDAFLTKFIGHSEKVELTKKTPANENQIEAVTGASYSSKGVIAAINTAIETYREMGALK